MLAMELLNRITNLDRKVYGGRDVVHQNLAIRSQFEFAMQKTDFEFEWLGSGYNVPNPAAESIHEMAERAGRLATYYSPRLREIQRAEAKKALIPNYYGEDPAGRRGGITREPSRGVSRANVKISSRGGYQSEGSPRGGYLGAGTSKGGSGYLRPRGTSAPRQSRNLPYASRKIASNPGAGSSGTGTGNGFKNGVQKTYRICGSTQHLSYGCDSLTPNARSFLADEIADILEDAQEKEEEADQEESEQNLGEEFNALFV